MPSLTPVAEATEALTAVSERTETLTAVVEVSPVPGLYPGTNTFPGSTTFPQAPSGLLLTPMTEA